MTEKLVGNELGSVWKEAVVQHIPTFGWWD
jgi:hypothetical protein